MNVNIVWNYLTTLYYWSVHMIFVFSYHLHKIYSINLECTINTIMYFSCWFISPYLVDPPYTIYTQGMTLEFLIISKITRTQKPLNIMSSTNVYLPLIIHIDLTLKIIS